MPVYNAGSFVKEAIDSILSQTFSDFEFIIINDGSTDNSEAIIKSFADPRILYIKNESNKGLIESLNLAFSLAQGKYIARMDADDISLPTRLEKQVRFMEANHGVGVCGCDHLDFNGSNKQHRAFTLHDEIAGWMLFNSSVVHPSVMIRKSVLSDIVFDKNYPHSEDYELWSRLIFKTGFSAVPEILFKYRVHPSQVTIKYRATQIESSDKVRRKILNSFGFKFTEEELRVHCLLGSSQLIRSQNDLRLLDQWFDKLFEQNKVSGKLNPSILEKILAKQWYDACGITSLGWKAFSIYTKSHWSSKYKGSRLKLLGKCILRRFN
jgi:glycosyltransferase involved in cell wall biosynthesis